MKKFLLIFTVLLFIFAFGIADKAFAAQISTPATGNVSSDSYGAGASVAVPNIVITEDNAGDIKAGSIMFTAPSGYKFDTTVVPTVTYTGAGTDLAGDAVITFIGETIMQFDITNASTTKGVVTISAPKVRVTSGTVGAAGNITMSGTITGLDGTSNFGTLTQVPGALPATGGLTVVTQHTPTETAGTSFTLTITQKDQYGNTIDFDTDDQTCAFTTTASVEGVSAANKPEYNNVDMTWVTNAWSVSDTNIDFENGVATSLAFELFTAGASKTINVSCTGLSTGTATSTVNPAAKTEVLFSSTKPTIGYTYQDISPTIAIKLVDTYGNVVTTDDTSEVTMKAYTSADCTSTAANPDLTGTKVLAVTDGIATFSLRYNTVNTTGIYIRAQHDVNGDTNLDDVDYDCTNAIKFYASTGDQVITSSGTTATTTTAPAATTTTTTSAAVTSMPQPAKPIAQMTQTEKNDYTMSLQQFLINLLVQLLNLIKAQKGL